MRKYIGGILILITLGYIYYSFNPDKSSIFPKCPFYLLTGLKCPGCGSQRATYYLLHFHFIEALKCNALMVISLPIVCILSYIELIRKRNPHLYAIAYKTKYIWAYLIIVIIWWICRNIFDL
jgi:hypothetical protein